MAQDTPAPDRVECYECVKPLERGTPTDDSARARARIAYFLSHQLSDWRSGRDRRERVVPTVRAEIGADVWPTGSSTVSKYLKKCTLSDFLGSITVICRALDGIPHGEARQLVSAGRYFIEFCNRALREENVRYEVDGWDGVHFFVDAEFQRVRLSALLSLERRGVDAAKHAFEQSYVALDGVPPDTLMAVRRIFEAIEVAIKALMPDAGISRLGATEVEKFVRPRILKRFDADGLARNNASETVSELKSWTNGLQAYRHGQDAPEPVQPPLMLAVTLISAGAAYLRFLVETLDAPPGSPAAP
jgi:hypothetical protein